jgi:hypothetical protein
MKIEPSTVELLRSIESFVFDNADELFVEFDISKYSELISASFSSDGVKIVYVLPTGRHVSDFILLNEFNAWVDKLSGEIK